jgi:hypothetical protein
MVYIKTVKENEIGACATHLVAPRLKLNAVLNICKFSKRARNTEQQIVVKAFHYFRPTLPILPHLRRSAQDPFYTLSISCVHLNHE